MLTSTGNLSRIWCRNGEPNTWTTRSCSAIVIEDVADNCNSRPARRRSRLLRERWAKLIRHPRRRVVKNQQIYFLPPHTSLQTYVGHPFKDWSTQLLPTASLPAARLRPLSRIHLKMAAAPQPPQKQAISITMRIRIGSSTRARRPCQYNENVRYTKPIRSPNLCGIVVL